MISSFGLTVLLSAGCPGNDEVVAGLADGIGDPQGPNAGSGQPVEAVSGIDGEPEPLHWAFRVIADPPPPAVSDAEWCRDPLDRFVLARLDEARLGPASAADRYTLLRRVTFGLTGLPPTPEEIEAFLSDPSEDALSQVVDRLLESEAYGERWARHWLDVARYGDSNGADENHAYPHAHHYRNWVIDALNRDLPYDRFVHEQFAGDLLPLPEDVDARAAQLTATGFLSIGTKILAEQDPVKRRMDAIDEQIDTLSKAFLGLTVACARCHDHKFDPISSEDYYALAGILHSTDQGDRAVETEEYLATRRDHEEQVRVTRAEVSELQRGAARQVIEAESERLEASLVAARELVRWRRYADPDRPYAERLGREELLAKGHWQESEEFARGNVIVDRDQYGSGIGIISDPGGQENFVEYDLDLPSGGNYQFELRYAAAAARPGRILVNGELVEEQAIRHVTGGWYPKDQRWHVEGVFEFQPGTNVVRVESSPNMSHLDQFALIKIDPAARVEREAESFDRGNCVIDTTQYGTGIGIVGDLGQNPLTFIEYDLEFARPGTYAVGIRYAAKTSRPMRLLLDEAVIEERALAAVTGDWMPGGQRWSTEARFVVEAGKATLRLESGQSLPHIDKLRISFLFDGSSTLRSAEQLAEQEGLRRGLIEALADAMSRRGETEPAWDPQDDETVEGSLADRLLDALTAGERRFTDPASALEPEYDDATRERLAGLRARWKKQEEAPPAPRMVMAVSDGTVVDLQLHVRGDHLRLGQVVPRRFLEVIAGEDQSRLPEDRSGRLQFARWLTNPEHPLTARVIVNRVWRWHFGEGLVRSPDNFGVRGQAPTHPQLLDHLARGFIEDGWSLKRLHRRILLSATYAMSAEHADAAAVDPENLLCARSMRRRLEPEALRDSILAMTGRLDRTVGGAPLMVTTANPSPEDYAKNRAFYEESRRRSVYLPVVRTHVYELFSLFDFPDPSVSEGDRETTTVPTQALFMLNSPWMFARAGELAAVVLADGAGAPRETLEHLYLLVYGRPCSDAEAALAESFLDDLPEDEAWTALCQVLLLSNELVYLN